MSLRYSVAFKFLAVVLCAVTLLGAVGSALGMFALTETGMYSRSYEEVYQEYLESYAAGYAQMVGQTQLSEILGGADPEMVNEFYGTDVTHHYFRDMMRVGCTLTDNQGNTLYSREMYKTYTPESVFQLPLMGSYLKVLEVLPREDYEAQNGVTGNWNVLTCPEEDTSVSAMRIDYDDGSSQEFAVEAGELGILQPMGNGEILFYSVDIGDLDGGPTPVHILFLGMDGTVVYEADGSGMILSYVYTGAATKLSLPAGPVPEDIWYVEGFHVNLGDYTAYDAIPEQGITVTSMNVSYGTPEEGTMGSEGIASPDLIGTIFHDHEGNVQFHSTEPMTMDIPETARITGISFMDAGDNVIYDAQCLRGVGILFNDENGYLVFQAVIPEEMPEEPVPETTVPETIPVETEPSGLVITVMEEVPVFNVPSTNGKELEKLKQGQEVTVLYQETFNGEIWGLTQLGWIRMEAMEPEEKDLQETVPETAAAVPTEAEEFPEESTAAAEETVPEETIALANVQTLPEETTAATEPEVAPVMETALAEATAAEVGYPEEAVSVIGYYDPDEGREMVAKFVRETIPDGYTVEIRLAEGAVGNGYEWVLLKLAYSFRSKLLQVLGICAAVCAVCMVYLCCAAGRRAGTDTVRASGLNRIPLDAYLGGGAFAGVGLAFLAVEGTGYLTRNSPETGFLFLVIVSGLICLLIVGFCFAFVAQIKTPDGFWWRNTVCGRCLKGIGICWNWLATGCKKCWKYGKPAGIAIFRWLGRVAVALWIFGKKTVSWLWDAAKRLWVWLRLMAKKGWDWLSKKFVRFFSLLPITWQFLVTGFALVFLLYVVLRSYKVGWILMGFGAFFAVILYAASAFGILLDSAKRMSKGDLDIKVDDKMLIGGFKDFSDELNALADVAVIAAQKQLKSERMKTELITNVSHDIKTPLTSIINYVDLLQKPHTEEQQTQYLEVLSRQSQRLKKLVDDLMEMSKASTGNLAVDISRMDAAEAINQSLGEFADKLERAQLTPVFRQPEEPVEILADGRLFWRVMSNLLSNAVKYALPGTRVYVDILEMEGKVIISMKNISREELNLQDADELMERFVRGDASRNTEGSGLGLNIARSLMELQKGQLQILVDGDLFKVTLIFPAA